MICRLCLLKIDVDNKVSIFTANCNDGESQIVKLIAKYLHLEVTQHDAISTTLCRDCWNHIDEFHKFWILVNEKQSSLRNEFLEVKCDVLLHADDVHVEGDDDDDDDGQNEESLCNMTDVLQETLEVQLKCEAEEINIFEEEASSHVDNLELSDDDIPLQKLTRRSLRKRAVVKTATESKPLYKKKATKKVKSAIKPKLLSFLEKIKVKKPKPVLMTDDDSDDDYESDNKRDDDYKPEDDGYLYYVAERNIEKDAQTEGSDGEQSATSANTKRKTKNPQKPKPTETLEEMETFISQNIQMKCDVCDLHFKKFSEARTHYKDQHKLREYIKCCGRRHGKMRDLYEHIKWHFDPEYFKCDTCGKLLKSTNSLEMHKVSKHLEGVELIFRCEHCDKRFARPYMLTNHLKNTHEAKKNFACQHCDKRFIRKYALSKHIQSMHDNVFPYICDICGMKFKFKPSFDTHVLEHQGVIEPPVQCPQCGVWTKNKNCLRTHLTTHNKVDVDCKYCGRVCASLSAMRAHIQKMHRRPPSYKCTFCDKLVKTPKDLKEHMATHTGVKLYNCPHCPKEFRSSSNMYVHIKRLHTEEWLAARLERPRKAPHAES